ncbi:MULTISPECIES: SpoIIE family protein phosphatase [unclassified Nocardioides]|uniref:SpoIIE family protein phosphatase n=1 Tax=unclassified Nocardioides TaxID=2615069 RepID=UPI0019102B94|nr:MULTISPECIES: SpoIIE family protein phosphatase [unclassified Nocardioides]
MLGDERVSGAAPGDVRGARETASDVAATLLASSSPFTGLGHEVADRLGVARQLAAAPGNVDALNRLAVLSARLLRASSAQVSLIADEQTVMGGVGAAATSVGVRSPAEESLCTVTVAAAAPVVVADARADGRVNGLPPVTSGAVGSYLGVPLVVRDQPVGALCVFDAEPREWSDEDVTLLEQLAGPVVAELQLAALAAEYEDERLLWQLAVDAAEVGAFDWNLDTGELRWDDRLLGLFGLNRETFGGTIDSFNEAVHPDDLDRVTEALTHAIETCGVYAAEYRVVWPDGGIRWVAARGRALAGPGGVASRLLGAAFDTTAVQDGEARVARVLESMPTAFFQLDRQWRFTYVNTEAHRLLGGIGREIVGGVIWELFPDAVGSDFEIHYRRAADSGRPVEFEAYYPPPLDAWYEIRAWPTPDGLSVYFFDITDRRRAQLAVTSATERTGLLSGITDALTGMLDIEDAVEHLAQAVVGRWGDWSIVTLVGTPLPSKSTQSFAGGGGDPGRVWRRGLADVAGWHIDPAARAMVERYLQVRIPSLSDRSFLARALRENRPVVVGEQAAEAIAGVLEPGEARELCLLLAPTSAVVVPLRGRGRTVGLLTVFRGAGRPRFSTEDIADLVDAAARAGLALDNSRLYAEQRDLAEGLQRSLMTAPPQADHVQVAVRYEPAAEAAQVGGDWYDSFLQPDGATSVVIGDVVGHDTVAAAAMGQVRGLLRGIAVTTGAGPSEVLRRVDEAMQTLQVETTATVVVARLEQTEEDQVAGTTRLRWSNAGHPPPLVAVSPQAAVTPQTATGSPPAVERAQVEVTALWPAQSELLLGLEPSFPRTESVVTLTRGSTLLLYTDGLVERRGQSVDDGVAKLKGVLADLLADGLGVEEMCDEVLARMLPERPEDDVAIVAVRLHPGDRPRPAEAGPENVSRNVAGA